MRSRSPGDEGPQLLQVGGDGAVGEHDALGGAGGPGGVREHGDVLGRVEGDLGLGRGGPQHVEYGGVALGLVADVDLLDTAREFGGPAGDVQEGGHGDDPACGGVPELFGELIRGGQRVDGGDGGAGPGRPVEDGRVGDRVGAVQGEHVALAQPGRGEVRGDAPVEGVELGVGDGHPVGAVDQCGCVTEVRGVPEDGFVDGSFEGLDVCVLAVEHHGGPLRRG